MTRPRPRPGVPVRRLSENRDFLPAVQELAVMCGAVRSFHHLVSRGTTPGWPDLVLIFRGHVLFRELKTDEGQLTAEQRLTLAQLSAAGLDAGVWRPADLASGRIQREMAEARRAKPRTGQ